MFPGYMGRTLDVDLTSQKCLVKNLTENEIKTFIGGSGLAAKMLYENTGPDTHPLGPDNVLIYMTAPFTGTKIPLSGRHEIATKSPLTGLFGESDVGGTWGTELRKAGFDGIIFRGRSQKPVYLWIHEENVEFRNADAFWGMDTYDLDDALKKETDPKAVISAIGPAGEQLALISAIMHDGRDGRPCARCGVGAVMGSKKLKAVVVRGSKKLQLANEDKVNQSIREMGRTIVKDAKRLHDYGTSGITTTLNELGDLPIKNWSQGKWDEGAERISGVTMAKTILSGNYYCGACIVGCGREVKIESGPFAPVEGAGPEYETVAMLGSMCLVSDLEAISKAHELCNRYGLDVISTGSVIAFAMEAYERGLITWKETDGLELRWGDSMSMLQLVEKIGRREGIGLLLGEGVKRAAEKIGGSAREFAVHVKGLELPGHDPRAYNSLAIGYATANRGACHLQGFSYAFERSITMPELGYNEIQDRFGTEGKGEFVAKTQDLMSLFDSLKLCKFILFGGVKVKHALDWLNSVTGWDWDTPTFLKTGERIFNLKRLYNVRCGVTRKDDVVPQRILALKRGVGGAAENSPPFEKMLDEYYQYRGWSEAGIPKQHKLEKLGLAEHVPPNPPT